MGVLTWSNKSVIFTPIVMIGYDLYIRFGLNAQILDVDWQQGLAESNSSMGQLLERCDRVRNVDMVQLGVRLEETWACNACSFVLLRQSASFDQTCHR